MTLTRGGKAGKELLKSLLAGALPPPLLDGAWEATRAKSPEGEGGLDFSSFICASASLSAVVSSCKLVTPFSFNV